MKKVLAFLFCLLPSLASAQIIPSLPYNLTNNTLADANQVMANFNQIVSSTNTNAANAGANTNITALNGLTTPLSPSSGGSSVYTGGLSSGTLNAQTLLNPTPLGFSLVSGRRVTFIAGFTNSGPLTLNINSTGATAVKKQSPAGLVALSGGEVVLNQAVDVWYDGTQYELLNAAPQSTVQSCTVIDYFGITVPTGYLPADGSVVSRATYANLFACIAITSAPATTVSGSPNVTLTTPQSLKPGWFVGGANVTCNSTITTVTDTTHIIISANAGATGATTLTIGPEQQGDCATTFKVPNMNGRATVMADDSGAVLTSTTCTNPFSVGTRCGAQTSTLAAGNIPTLTSTNAAQNISVTVAPGGTGANRLAIGATGDLTAYSGTGAGAFVSIYSPAGSWTFTNSLSGTTSNSISTTYTNASPTAVPVVQPITLVYKAIKT